MMTFRLHSFSLILSFYLSPCYGASFNVVTGTSDCPTNADLEACGHGVGVCTALAQSGTQVQFNPDCANGGLGCNYQQHKCCQLYGSGIYIDVPEVNCNGGNDPVTPTSTSSTTATSSDYPIWGCGLLGSLPGVNSNNTISGDMRLLINGLKQSSSLNKVSYWNWAYTLADQGGGMQYLTDDFIFMPENWGVDVVNNAELREANASPFSAADGSSSPGIMGNILLGANEPDITGSCMGTMMGSCTASCIQSDYDSGTCKVAHLHGEQGSETAINGRCDCYSDSHATGVGFWPVGFCPQSNQPLPTLWTDYPDCGVSLVNTWRTSAKFAWDKGYKYQTTPLVAVNMDYIRSFLEAACAWCTSVECGCPSHIGWHFYASDCRPVSAGGYADFQNKLDATVSIMNDFPHLKGAIVNEIGMLNCAMDSPDSDCVPNGPHQQYPANQQPGNTCPPNDEMPNGMASFLEELITRSQSARAADGRPAVVGISWFQEKMSGGTYDLRLFDDDGNLNSLGQQYIDSCIAWGASVLD